MNASLVVISHYDRRPLAPVRRLLASFTRRPAGAAFDVCVVVNQTRAGLPALRFEGRPVRVLGRENAGMNIGAWEYGWRAAPGYSHYLFLQDECEAVAEGWLAAYLARAADPGVGLLGCSLNTAWDKPWDTISRARAGEVLPGHLGEDGQPVERVALYLDCMRRWGVDPGATGRHLRALSWLARRETLEAIGGFPIGTSYGECIAAEIAGSRKVEAMGLRVEQVAPEPFTYFRHGDWAQAKPGGPFLHTRSRKRGFMRRLLGG